VGWSDGSRVHLTGYHAPPELAPYDEDDYDDMDEDDLDDEDDEDSEDLDDLDEDDEDDEDESDEDDMEGASHASTPAPPHGTVGFSLRRWWGERCGLAPPQSASARSPTTRRWPVRSERRGAPCLAPPCRSHCTGGHSLGAAACVVTSSHQHEEEPKGGAAD